MADTQLIIRQETRADYKAVLQLTYQAFLTIEYPGRQRVDEHYLIHLLQGSASIIHALCFVAERDSEIVGHILYTKSQFQRSDGSNAEIVIFGPLSVLPKLQRQGIGAALVRHSLKKALEMDFGAVLIMGWPDYYTKLGFKRASEYDLIAADGSTTDAFMAYELVPGYLDGGGTHIGWAPEFDRSEKDDVEYEAFHRQFMAEYCK